MHLTSKVRLFITDWNSYDPTSSAELMVTEEEDLKLHNSLISKLPDKKENSEPKKEPKKCKICCRIKKEFKRLQMFCCKKKEK